MSARTRTLLAASLLLAMAGCQASWNPWKKKPQPVTRPPDLTMSVAQFAGSTLSGASAQPVEDAAFKTAWTVSLRVIAAQNQLGPPFNSIGPEARLVVGNDPSDVLAPSAQLVHTAKAVDLTTGDALEPILNYYGPWDDLRTLSGIVAVGSTAALNVSLPDSTEKNATFSRRGVRVMVSRQNAGDAYQLALASDDLVLPGLIEGGEKLVFDRSLKEGKLDHVVITLPMAFPGSAAKALVLDLSVSSTASADQITAAKAEIDASAAKIKLQLAAAPAAPGAVAITAALDAINAQPASRGGLDFLADETGATLTRSVVLAADEDVLKLITDQVRKRAPNLKKQDKASVGWMLDRSTIAAIGSIKEDDQARLLPAVQGALTAYAGEVGRQLDLLQSLANQSVSSRDLDAHIIAEHRIALEDISPALRVRAYDWLNERGQGPANYDPLGKPRERRAALEKYQEATTQPSQQ